MIFTKSREVSRSVVFLAVGVFNTILDFAFYTFLTSVVFKNGNNIALAGLISGTFALAIAFIAHGLITWRGAKLTHKTLVKFVLFTGFGMWIIRPLLLSIFIKLTGLYTWVQNILDDLGIHLSYAFIANTGAFGLMLVVVLTYNYLVYSRFVFIESPDTVQENR